jgi:S-DNA-T family DNA segregation ATPase FtsK/SpoIIIE
MGRRQTEIAHSENQTWHGPRYYVVVDDYEGVATLSPQSGNPLNDLESFLVTGQDMGLHLLLARRVTELTRTSYDAIFRAVRNTEAPGLLMRGDPSDGRQALHKQNVSNDLPGGRGIYVTRNAPPLLLQVARSDAP